MKQLLIFLIIMIMLTTTGCKSKMTIEDYVVEYDTNMYNLEKFISDDLYLANCTFFQHKPYFDFSNGPYKQSLEQLIKILDDVMFNLGELGPKIDDAKIQQYQSKIEYALKDIRNKVNNYTYLDTITTNKPTKSTLYKETYWLMNDISGSLIDLKTNMTQLEDYVDPYRNKDSNIDLNELRELKTKNRLRILYTYLYTASYIASYDDYTGLHTNPKIPIYLSFNDGMFKVYELSLNILKPTKEFANNYFEFKDVLEQLEDKTSEVESIKYIDENILEYAKLLYNPLKSMSTYFNIRHQLDDDFYTSGQFKEYQKYDRTLDYGTKKYVLYDFDESRKDYDFTLMRTSYMDIKSFSIREKYFSLMFSPEELKKVGITQE